MSTDFRLHQSIIELETPGLPELERLEAGRYRCGHCGHEDRIYLEGSAGFHCRKCWRPNRLPTQQKEMF